MADDNIVLVNKDNIPYLVLINRDKILYLLRDLESTPIPTPLPRQVELPVGARKVVVLLGMRRVGKTYLLYSTMQRLLRQGVKRAQLLYLNFEDDRLLPLQGSDLNIILDCHRELHPELEGQTRHFFFDEVQAIPGWERFVRRLHDTQSGDIYITGSSSSLLSREVATSMRGRALPYEIFPLSFREFLQFRGIERVRYSTESDIKIKCMLEEYVETGGLPEVVLAAAEIQPRILKDYCDLIFYRDLLERYRLTNQTLLRELLRHVLGGPASLLNINKLAKDIRSRGLSFGKDTIHRYLAVMEESFVFFSLPVTARSLRKRAVNPRKIHPVDWSLGYWMHPRKMIDRGHRLETLMYLELRRRREALGYIREPNEIDLVEGIDDPERYLNITWNCREPGVLDRELRGLTQPGLSKGAERLLVSHEPSAIIMPSGVREIEAFRFLLGED